MARLLRTHPVATVDRGDPARHFQARWIGKDLATPGLGPDVERYQNEEWGLYQRDKALRGMRYFDTILRVQPFVAGDVFSMADIAVIAGLIFAGLLDVAAPAECDALVTWYDKMQERPSVKNRVTMSEKTTA